VTEAHQLSARFIPKAEGERLKALEKRHWFHRLKQRMCFVTSREIVVWDSRAQMVDVVIADIA